MRRVATLLCFAVLAGCSGHSVTQTVPAEKAADGGTGDDAGRKVTPGEPKTNTGTPRSNNNTATRTNASVGINLSAVNYYATQLPFSNLFMNRDAWLSTDGSTWDTEQAASIPVDADGYPLELPYEGQLLRASAFLPIHGDTYELTWKGDGEVSVVGPDLEVVSRAANSLRFSVSASMTDSVFVRIDSSSAEDHVRGIEIHGQRDYGAIFRDSLRGFGVLRFMDWGQTNNSPVAHWSERTTPNQAQGTEHGVAIEHMIDIANAVQANMWFNVPHQADDDYVQRAAQLIDEKLDKKLKVYVEYSNENWNGIFSQVQWEQARGLALGLDELGGGHDSEAAANFWAGMNFAVRRAAFVHSVFKRVLGQRAVAVLAGQSANPGLNDMILSAYEDSAVNPLGGTPDALAVAPYFGLIYDDPDAADAITVEKILSDADSSIAELVGDNTASNRSVADSHGVELIAYEAGQHVLGAGGLENDKEVVQRMIEANRNPRMGELYRKAHRAWIQGGGKLSVYFSFCEAPGKFGSWGALEYQDQPSAEAPKWAALLAIMQD
jgi:hypothetical protein